MPHFEDDDDGDNFQYTPYRGCLDCRNGQQLSCDFGDCSCNTALMASTYFCAFKRWDIDTVSLQQITTDPQTKAVQYQGKAR